MGAMALVPGMPTIPFLLLGGVAGATSWSLIKTRAAKEQEEARAAQIVRATAGAAGAGLAGAAPAGGGAGHRRGEPAPHPLARRRASGASGSRTSCCPRCGTGSSRTSASCSPGCASGATPRSSRDSQYAIYVHEVPVATGEALAGPRSSPPTSEQARALGLDGPPGVHPLTGRPGVWVPEEAARDAAPGASIAAAARRVHRRAPLPGGQAPRGGAARHPGRAELPRRHGGAGLRGAGQDGGAQAR